MSKQEPQQGPSPAPEGVPELPVVALDFNCPTCKVDAGQPCVNKDGERTKIHTARGGPIAS